MKDRFWIKSAVLLLLLIFARSWQMHGEGRRFGWDFSDCEIGDILFAVSMDTGISIVADDTVSGKGNFRFSGSDFETAFDSFLTGARLYVHKSEDLWTVSRFRLLVEDGLVSLDAYDMASVLLMEKLSLGLGAAITYESLPAVSMTVHFKNLAEADLMEKICLRFQGYEVVRNEGGYHFGKKIVNPKVGNDVSKGAVRVEFTDGEKILIDARDVKVSDVLEKLFELRDGVQFCVMANTDVRLVRCSFEATGFEVGLERFCNLNGFGCIKKDGVFFIVADAFVKDGLVSDGKSWECFALKFIKAERLFGLLNKRFGKLECLALPDEFSFLCLVSENEKKDLLEFIGLVDVKTETYAVDLKYLKADEVMKVLPPVFDRSCVFVAENKSVLFFKGDEDSYRAFERLVLMCDRPVQRLSYDLLVLQFDEGCDGNWNSNLSARGLKLGDRNEGFVNLGQSLNLNLNVVMALGIDFAAGLQSSIEEHKTRVYADTKLYGVSGKQISFQNTNTYRYRDNNLDPETGKPVYSGITKEIVSGLKIDVTGYVGGDNAITSIVTASVTRQGNDTSGSTGNPPATTEKIVTTEVRGRSGEPIVLSGLMQNSVSENERRTPLFSRIPVIGGLFKSREKIEEKSQMTIYLIPHIEGNDFEMGEKKRDGSWAMEKCSALYGELFRGAGNEGI